LATLGSESETCVGSCVRLVGASLSLEKNFYRLPFTPPPLWFAVLVVHQLWELAQGRARGGGGNGGSAEACACARSTWLPFISGDGGSETCEASLQRETRGGRGPDPGRAGAGDGLAGGMAGTRLGSAGRATRVGMCPLGARSGGERQMMVLGLGIRQTSRRGPGRRGSAEERRVPRSGAGVVQSTRSPF
jgi:hypothetical protein